MPEDSEYLCICRLDGIINIISKKWALLIINSIGNRGRARFKQIEGDLEGISPKTLADTLKDLQNEQLIGRESFNEIPPRVEYYLTDEGKSLRCAIVPLLKWAASRDNHGSGKCPYPCKNGPNGAKRITLK
ncbi:HxlR family transcriptional regulator [Methanocella paludicola SANAE]|uniref:HxlR family transcriptional regulator n=1 Tax=Methanocella paludicola (strain DSM 17711 / JCM 13418 / NBRC 101707 / SANAE) TaxID=304371 RepID=D1YZR4_METPS|nr:helix-turn-helix domain-containing protein [Methanocella paludicola]BAI61936.1 HxlR family transcriptional regulator [Methanocella paludicola SANAE]